MFHLSVVSANFHVNLYHMNIKSLDKKWIKIQFQSTLDFTYYVITGILEVKLHIKHPMFDINCIVLIPYW